MRIYLKSLLLLSVLIIILTFVPVLTHAQIANPLCDPIDNTDAYGNPCPIDGGLGILLAAGVGYGIKKLRDTRKKVNFTHEVIDGL